MCKDAYAPRASRFLLRAFELTAIAPQERKIRFFRIALNCVQYCQEDSILYLRCGLVAVRLVLYMVVIFI
jgi:hypothetical protein